MSNDLARAVEAAWETRESLGVTSKGAPREAMEAALEGLDNDEISDVLGISVGNVAVRLHRAKQQVTIGDSKK